MNETINKALDWLFKVAVLAIAGGIGFFVHKLDEIEKRVVSIQIQQASIEERIKFNVISTDDKTGELKSMAEKVKSIEISFGRLKDKMENIEATSRMIWYKVAEDDPKEK